MCCRRNSLLITESERTYIKNLYGLLTEADDKSQITLKADSTFKSGKYSQLTPEGNAELQGELQKATAWMTQNKGSIVFVQIKATESQLTNYDTEQDPKVPVDPKVLSRLRAKTLKRYLTEYFKSLVDSGVLTEMPIFQEPKIDIGPTPYVKGKTTLTPDLMAKYEAEQNVSVELKLMSPEKCLINLEIEVKYDNVKNSSFPCRGGHTCDEARFDVKLNGVSIGVANLNNEVDGGSRSSGVLKIDETKAKQIIGVNVKKVTFSLKCLSGSNCHSGTPEVVIKKNGETLFHQCSPAMSRGDLNEYPILTLDVCGNVIEKGTGDSTNKDVAATQTTETKNGYTLTLPEGKNDMLITGMIERGDLVIKSKNPKIKQWNDFGWMGDAVVGPKGIRYLDKNKNKRVMDVDPGTPINKIVYFGKPNDNPPPNFKNTEGLTYRDETSSGKYHLETVGDTKTDNWYYELSPGPNTFTLDDEKSKNIFRFKLDDEKIEEFENYYIPKKLVEKMPDGTYKVIATKMSYVGKTYDKGAILKLEE